MQTEIIVPERFRGPPFSGNGGYVSGAFALQMDPDFTHPVEVTLRSPIPLDKSMQVVRGEGVQITDGDTLIAEVRPGELNLTPPPHPDWQTVRDAMPSSLAFQKNMNDLVKGTGFHPICFCCGADHTDGLGVHVAATGTDDVVAAIWETKTDWADEDGCLPVSYLWTAMDCPGQFAYYETGIRTGMLGRMTGRILRRPEAGTELLVMAWPIEVERSKHFAGCILATAEGEVIGEAVTVWIGRRN